VAVTYLQGQPLQTDICYWDTTSRPSNGGLADVFPSTGNRTNIVMVDVCSRDAQAERSARYLRHIVHVWADKHTPGNLLHWANRAVYQRIAEDGDDRFASLFFATVQRHVLTYSAAGHICGFLIDENGEMRRLPPTGTVLGLSPTEHYQESVVHVAHGKWLIIVTDGVASARDAEHTFFGASGVLQRALIAAGTGLDDPAARILSAARTHGLVRYGDEGAVLCVRLFES
jgi:serine phosphatase RsbU (regulator of sigma subunit)